MNGRFKTGGKPAKTRRRKATTLKRRNGSKAVPRSNSPATQEETEVTRLTSELNEAREQQTATLDVLQVISSSLGELEPVFQAILANAVNRRSNLTLDRRPILALTQF